MEKVMAHPNTEAEVQTDEATNETETNSNPEYTRQHATRNLNLEEAALELESIFAQEDAPQQIEASEESDHEEKEPLKIEPDDEEADVEEDAESEEEQEESEQDEEPDEEVEAIPAPVSWSKEQKAIFDALPPEAKEIIVARESERDKGFQVKATELANERQQTQQLHGQLLAAQEQLANFYVNSMGQNLVKPDPRNYDDIYQFQQDHAVYEQQVSHFQNMQHRAAQYQQQRELNEQNEQRAFEQERNAKLAELVPQFSDSQWRDELLKFGVENNLDPSGYAYATADEFKILAMAQRCAKYEATKPQIKDQVKNAPKVQKPGTRSRSSNKNSLNKAQARLRQSGSIQDAAAVLEHIL